MPVLRRNPGPALTLHCAPSLRQAAGQRPKGQALGELVQIDTLFVNVRPDLAIKHFTGYDPVAKWTIGHVATAASAHAARDLLDKLIKSAPFKVRGVQVDGGSARLRRMGIDSRRPRVTGGSE